MSRYSLIAVPLALCILGNTVKAAEGRIPIFAAATIAAPGRYFVSNNIATAAGSVITISAGNVDIDLNGFVLSSTAAAPVITATGVDGIAIRNGKISGGTSAIAITSGARILIEDVQAVGATAMMTGAIQLSEVTQFVVRRVMVRDAAGGGIGVEDAAPVIPAGGTIEYCTIENTSGGISINSSVGAAIQASIAIIGNHLKNINGNGIYFADGSACVISDNILSQISSYGMFLQTYRSRLTNNVISNTGANAIGLQQNGSDNFIMGNVVTQSGRGLFIGGTRNHLEGNVANNNTSFGIQITGTNHLYRRNSARGNGGVAGSCPAMCSPDLCVFAGAATSGGDNYLPGPPGFPACM